MTYKFQIGPRSHIMTHIRSRGNKSTELRLARAFRAKGITGWRRHQPLPGRPDFAFRSSRLAVFVDGCFWHGCPKHGNKPRDNIPYWRKKISGNIKRDLRVRRELRARGWSVMRIWEHDLTAERLAATVKRVQRRLSIA